jgi:hypothetical protein
VEVVFPVGRCLYRSEAKESGSMTLGCLINSSLRQKEKESVNTEYALRTNLKTKRRKEHILIIVDSDDIAEVKQKDIAHLRGIIVESNSEAYRALKDYTHKPVWAVQNGELPAYVSTGKNKGSVKITESIEHGEYIIGHKKFAVL